MHRALLLCSYPATALWASNMAIIIRFLTHSESHKCVSAVVVKLRLRSDLPSPNSCLILFLFCFKNISPCQINRSDVKIEMIEMILTLLKSLLLHATLARNPGLGLGESQFWINDCEF